MAGKEGGVHEKSIVSVDGKESRGSKRKSGSQGEVKALKTLRLMDLKDTIVTADAVNCQKDTVPAIVSGKGDYALALKGNQQRFHEEVRDYFEDFTSRDDKNTSMGKTSGKNLQIMKKIELSILGLVKESYKISMKRIRYELSYWITKMK